jgi:hypothetical protein
LERLIGDWAEYAHEYSVYRFAQVEGGCVEFGLMVEPRIGAKMWWRVGGLRWAGDVLRFGLEIGFEDRHEPIGGGRRPHAVWVSGIGDVVAVESAMPGWVMPKIGFWRRMK